jgi:REP-associated tyrosine transposase
VGDWPHGPAHRLGSAGMYMVTAGTYQKTPIFSSRSRLDLLLSRFFEVTEEHHASLQAWALFPNHYHFVAEFVRPEELTKLVRHFHSLTAREVNLLDRVEARKVWHQYYDSKLTFERSYFARLHYVHDNAVHHGLVKAASNYPWCSAGWFERRAEPAFRKTIESFRYDEINVDDDFSVDGNFLKDPSR